MSEEKVVEKISPEAFQRYQENFDKSKRKEREAIRRDPPSIMNVLEAAAYLDLSTRTVYNMAGGGEMPGVKVKGVWKFPKASLDAWLMNKAQDNLGDKK